MTNMPDWLQDRALSPKGYERALVELGLNQSSAARFLGISGRQSRRYVAGDANVPPPIALLLRALIAHGIRFGRAKRARKDARMCKHEDIPVTHCLRGACRERGICYWG